MFGSRTRFRLLAGAAVFGLVVASCAASQDSGSTNGSDEVPAGAAGTCLEGTPDCDDTPGDAALPPFAVSDGGDSLGLVVDGGLTITDALAYRGTEVVAVQGYIVTQDATTRLCEALAESFPPQCGAAGVVITNPAALPQMALLEEGTTQWSENPVTVLGDIVDGELTVASNVSASAPPAVDPDDEGVRAIQIDDVWVFEYSPNGGMDALHGGTPAIINGCLVIDDTIVVWDSGNLREAEAAIAAVRAGENPQLLIAGGGLSVEEGTDPSQIPKAISQRCPTDAVWFAAP